MSPRDGDGDQRVQTISLAVLATVATGFALYWLRPALIPFVLALFVALGLSLCVEWLVGRMRVPRWLALPVTLVLGLALLSLVGGLVGASLAELADSAPAYVRQLGLMIDRVTGWLPEELAARLGERGADLREIPVGTVRSVLASTSSALLGVLSQSFLVLVFVIFLFLGGFSSESPAGSTLAAVRRSVERYLVTKLVVSAMTGVLVGTVLVLLGIPLAVTFGVLAFLLNFIPSIGSVIATLLPLPVVVVSPEVSGTSAVAAILVPGAIQIGIGNVLEPWWMGDALDLHPVAILLSLIFWGTLWGVVGMFLATPITAGVKLVLARFEGSAPLAELLAGRLPGDVETPTRDASR